MLIQIYVIFNYLITKLTKNLFTEKRNFIYNIHVK